MVLVDFIGFFLHLQYFWSPTVDVKNDAYCVLMILTPLPFVMDVTDQRRNIIVEDEI
jgi:hypothetical protein